MTTKNILTFIIISAVIIGVILALPESEIRHSPGILVNESPYQKSVDQLIVLHKGDYTIKALMDFRITGRVLSVEGYSFDRESDLSPCDFAMGWGPMSDQSVLDEIDISQKNRWYYWQTDTFPIPREEIETNSANMHLIPSNDEIDDKLGEVVRGNLVEIEGYLVEIIGNDGWKWKSSLSRTDTGNGACELIWVERIKIIR